MLVYRVGCNGLKKVEVIKNTKSFGRVCSTKCWFYGRGGFKPVKLLKF